MLFSTLSIAASAAIISDHPLTEQEIQDIAGTPSTSVYTTCTGGNGICQMYSQGWAFIYDEETGELLDEYNMNCAWQCKNCHTVMVTSGDPKLGVPIGHYVVVACSYDLGTTAFHYVYIDPSDIQYCSTINLSGYRFYNS